MDRGPGIAFSLTGTAVSDLFADAQVVPWWGVTAEKVHISELSGFHHS